MEEIGVTQLVAEKLLLEHKSVKKAIEAWKGK